MTWLKLVLVLTSFAPIAARAAASDLADYDCTRTDDGKIVTGDRLATAGFQITSMARFGSTRSGAVNLKLTDPKSKVSANCFKRQPK